MVTHCCLYATVYESKAYFSVFTGCFQPFPCLIHCSSLPSFSVNGVLHAEQHRPDFCTIISSDRTLALFRMAAIGSCDRAAVSLMCTSVRVRCFIRSPCFIPGFSLHLHRSVHHSEDTLLELTQKHEQFDAEPRHPPLILILCNLSSLNSSFLRLDYIIIL